jgi:uncharacterized protein YoaH (UPF0181 family)
LDKICWKIFIQQVFSSKFSTGAALAVVATELEAQAALVA